MWNDTVIETIRAAPGPSLDLSPLALGIHHIATPAARFNAVRAILSSLKYLEPSERRQRVDAVASLAGTELPSALMLSSQQVRGLASAGMGIGGHTVSHPILTRIDDAAARREIADGRETLQAITGQPVRQFAYPNGQPGTDYAAAHVRMVKEWGSRLRSRRPGVLLVREVRYSSCPGSRRGTHARRVSPCAWRKT